MARKRKKLPLLENIEILAAGAKGKCIARNSDERVILVSNVVPGDIANIQITKKKRAYLEGSPTEIIKYSDKRTTPKCEHFGVCGGCKWQHMDYKYQLEYKENEVLNNLKRIGKVEIEETLAILPCEETFFYRNKMEFSFSDSRWLTQEEICEKEANYDRNAIGFHIPGKFDKILDLKNCYLQEEPSNSIRLEVRDFASKHGMQFYNARKQAGFLRTLMIRTSTTGDVMVLVQFFHEDVTNRELLLSHLAEKFPEITALLYVINSKGNDTIYDQDVIVFKGKDHIMEQMEDLTFKIDAKSFYQTNSKQAYELYQVARNFADLQGDELVYDLYTGTGTIAQFVAKKAKKVVGIESVPEAIQAAKENATRNKIDNASFFVGDMKDIFNEAFIKQNGAPDIVITDPPRDGMHKNVVAQLLQLAPKKIVYISCNSATQARDLELMKEQYRVVKSQAVDMFPHTHHIENVVLMIKK
jgi:23S rRNA (uracil1939-C5)-methyltransferase